MASSWRISERQRQLEDIALDVAGLAPEATSVATIAAKHGLFGRKSDEEFVMLALAPPFLHIQPVDEKTLAITAPPLTLTKDDLSHVAVHPHIAEIRGREERITVEVELRFRDGRRFELLVPSGAIYGDEATPSIRARTTAICDAIVDWLKSAG
ncbi:MAG: hypothetical protein ACSLFF_10440 [Solirubrobacterales bacterium]